MLGSAAAAAVRRSLWHPARTLCTQRMWAARSLLPPSNASAAAFSALAPVPSAPRSVVEAAAAAAAADAAEASSAAGGLSDMVNRDDSLSHISGYDKHGFTVNGIHLRGSVLVFRNFSLLWHVPRVLDVCPRNLAVIHMVRPRPGACAWWRAPPLITMQSRRRRRRRLGAAPSLAGPPPPQLAPTRRAAAARHRRHDAEC